MNTTTTAKSLTFADLAAIAKELREVEIKDNAGIAIGVVYLRSLTAGEVMDFADAQTDDTKEAKTKQFMLVSSILCDSSGARIIPPGEEAKAAEIPAHVFTQISAAINTDLGTKSAGEATEAGGPAGKE